MTILFVTLKKGVNMVNLLRKTGKNCFAILFIRCLATGVNDFKNFVQKVK